MNTSCPECGASGGQPPYLDATAVIDCATCGTRYTVAPDGKRTVLRKGRR